MNEANKRQERNAAGLTKDQLKQFRQLLITERAKLAGEIRSIAHDTSTSPRDASGDLSGYTVHMADMAADTYERELSMNIVSSEQALLYQIDEALKHIDEGTYGICQQCSQPISTSRLKAVPYAILCIDCKRSKEKKDKR
ncbi:MAG: TraR/DksA C4-type zinc finger protein [Candidatus Omnitrophica bacterium]|nr:TraR/DksA C4-type zinc finger protein [Candidatus Omnitrophota bacterium]MBI3010772.1 TraR/DksA C4-type zinc finger protein [Candidatus Omnitrophota bacterium]